MNLKTLQRVSVMALQTLQRASVMALQNFTVSISNVLFHIRCPCLNRVTLNDIS